MVFMGFLGGLMGGRGSLKEWEVGRGFVLFSGDFWNWILRFLILCRGAC